MTDSALSLLQPDEICVIVLHDGKEREATWSPEDKCFHYWPPADEDPVPHAEVCEWWSASVKF